MFVLLCVCIRFQFFLPNTVSIKSKPTVSRIMNIALPCLARVLLVSGACRERVWCVSCSCLVHLSLVYRCVFPRRVRVGLS
jgi:hypothetical protein